MNKGKQRKSPRLQEAYWKKRCRLAEQELDMVIDDLYRTQKLRDELVSFARAGFMYQCDQCGELYQPANMDKYEGQDLQECDQCGLTYCKECKEHTCWGPWTNERQELATKREKLNE